MKFMKLGSKPDSFQTDGDDVRYEEIILFAISFFFSSNKQVSICFFFVLEEF